MDNGIDEIFLTAWGDDGNECPIHGTYPVLMYAAEKLRGNSDMESIKAKFREIVGVPFDAFTAIEELENVGGAHDADKSPAKYLLYNDVHMGIMDYLVSEEDNDYYAGMAKKLSALDFGKLDYVFRPYVKLAEALSVKAALGVKTRVAYLMSDRDALRELLGDYDEAVKKIREFYAAFRTRWLTDNKPQGFEIQDVRLGGLIMRIESAKARLVDYIEGRIEEIPELKEEILPPPDLLWARYAIWRNCVSANIMTHADNIFA